MSKRKDREDGQASGHLAAEEKLGEAARRLTRAQTTAGDNTAHDTDHETAARQQANELQDMDAMEDDGQGEDREGLELLMAASERWFPKKVRMICELKPAYLLGGHNALASCMYVNCICRDCKEQEKKGAKPNPKPFHMYYEHCSGDACPDLRDDDAEGWLKKYGSAFIIKSGGRGRTFQQWVVEESKQLGAEQLAGQQLHVYWYAEEGAEAGQHGTWFRATILEFNATTGWVEVEYQDGDQQKIFLPCSFVHFGEEPPPSRFKHAHLLRHPPTAPPPDTLSSGGTTSLLPPPPQPPSAPSLQEGQEGNSPKAAPAGGSVGSQPANRAAGPGVQAADTAGAVQAATPGVTPDPAGAQATVDGETGAAEAATGAAGIAEQVDAPGSRPRKRLRPNHNAPDAVVHPTPGAPDPELEDVDESPGVAGTVTAAASTAGASAAVPAAPEPQKGAGSKAAPCLAPKPGEVNTPGAPAGNEPSAPSAESAQTAGLHMLPCSPSLEPAATTSTASPAHTVDPVPPPHKDTTASAALHTGPTAPPPHARHEEQPAGPPAAHPKAGSAAAPTSSASQPEEPRLQQQTSLNRAGSGERLRHVNRPLAPGWQKLQQQLQDGASRKRPAAPSASDPPRTAAPATAHHSHSHAAPVPAQGQAGRQAADSSVQQRAENRINAVEGSKPAAGAPATGAGRAASLPASRAAAAAAAVHAGAPAEAGHQEQQEDSSSSSGAIPMLKQRQRLLLRSQAASQSARSTEHAGPHGDAREPDSAVRSLPGSVRGAEAWNLHQRTAPAAGGAAAGVPGPSSQRHASAHPSNPSTTAPPHQAAAAAAATAASNHMPGQVAKAVAAASKPPSQPAKPGAAKPLDKPGPVALTPSGLGPSKPAAAGSTRPSAHASSSVARNKWSKKLDMNKQRHDPPPTASNPRTDTLRPLKRTKWSGVSGREAAERPGCSPGCSPTVRSHDTAPHPHAQGGHSPRSQLHDGRSPRSHLQEGQSPRSHLQDGPTPTSTPRASERAATSPTARARDAACRSPADLFGADLAGRRSPHTSSAHEHPQQAGSGRLAEASAAGGGKQPPAQGGRPAPQPEGRSDGKPHGSGGSGSAANAPGPAGSTRQSQQQPSGQQQQGAGRAGRGGAGPAAASNDDAWEQEFANQLEKQLSAQVEVLMGSQPEALQPDPAVFPVTPSDNPNAAPAATTSAPTAASTQAAAQLHATAAGTAAAGTAAAGTAGTAAAGTAAAGTAAHKHTVPAPITAPAAPSPDATSAPITPPGATPASATLPPSTAATPPTPPPDVPTSAAASAADTTAQPAAAAGTSFAASTTQPATAATPVTAPPHPPPLGPVASHVQPPPTHPTTPASDAAGLPAAATGPMPDTLPPVLPAPPISPAPPLPPSPPPPLPDYEPPPPPLPPGELPPLPPLPADAPPPLPAEPPVPLPSPPMPAPGAGGDGRQPDSQQVPRVKAEPEHDAANMAVPANTRILVEPEDHSGHAATTGAGTASATPPPPPPPPPPAPATDAAAAAAATTSQPAAETGLATAPAATATADGGGAGTPPAGAGLSAAAASAQPAASAAPAEAPQPGSPVPAAVPAAQPQASTIADRVAALLRELEAVSHHLQPAAMDLNVSLLFWELREATRGLILKLGTQRLQDATLAELMETAAIVLDRTDLLRHVLKYTVQMHSPEQMQDDPASGGGGVGRGTSSPQQQHGGSQQQQPQPQPQQPTQAMLHAWKQQAYTDAHQLMKQLGITELAQLHARVMHELAHAQASRHMSNTFALLFFRLHEHYLINDKPRYSLLRQTTADTLDAEMREKFRAAMFHKGLPIPKANSQQPSPHPSPNIGSSPTVSPTPSSQQPAGRGPHGVGGNSHPHSGSHGIVATSTAAAPQRGQGNRRLSALTSGAAGSDASGSGTRRAAMPSTWTTGQTRTNAAGAGVGGGSGFAAAPAAGGAGAAAATAGTYAAQSDAPVRRNPLPGLPNLLPVGYSAPAPDPAPAPTPATAPSMHDLDQYQIDWDNVFNDSPRAPGQEPTINPLRTSHSQPQPGAQSYAPSRMHSPMIPLDQLQQTASMPAPLPSSSQHNVHQPQQQQQQQQQQHHHGHHGHRQHQQAHQQAHQQGASAVQPPAAPTSWQCYVPQAKHLIEQRGWPLLDQHVVFWAKHLAQEYHKRQQEQQEQQRQQALAQQQQQQQQQQAALAQQALAQQALQMNQQMQMMGGPLIPQWPFPPPGSMEAMGASMPMMALAQQQQLQPGMPAPTPFGSASALEQSTRQHELGSSGAGAMPLAVSPGAPGGSLAMQPAMQHEQEPRALTGMKAYPLCTLLWDALSTLQLHGEAPMVTILQLLIVKARSQAKLLGPYCLLVLDGFIQHNLLQIANALAALLDGDAASRIAACNWQDPRVAGLVATYHPQLYLDHTGLLHEFSKPPPTQQPQHTDIMLTVLRCANYVGVDPRVKLDLAAKIAEAEQRQQAGGADEDGPMDLLRLECLFMAEVVRGGAADPVRLQAQLRTAVDNFLRSGFVQAGAA